jgi:hypothetical protein
MTEIERRVTVWIEDCDKNTFSLAEQSFRQKL